MAEKREMPNDLEAEESLLGSCFLSKYALQKASEALNPDAFYDNRNKIIFEAMLKLQEEGTPLDITTITSYLKKKDQLTPAGGLKYLTEIINYVPTASHSDYYMKIVEDNAVVRSLIQTAEQIADEGYSKEESINEILDNSEKRILNIVKKRTANEFKDVTDVLEKAQSDLEKLSKNKGEITGLDTGILELNQLTTGLHSGELIIVAARPAMGKTAFALQIATHVALTQEKTVAIFNMEMPAEQLMMRIISNLESIDGAVLRTGKLYNNDWTKVNEAASKLVNANLVFDDTAGITIGEIRAKCRRLANSEKGLALVVIDYLQLISGGKNYGTNRQQEISDISRSLKTLALELEIPIIALSQLSRNVETRDKTNRRPMMSDLRESGAIEQDADIVSFLFREDYYDEKKMIDPTNPNISKSELIIGKHRNGPTKTIDLLFKKNYSKFDDYAEREEAK